MRFFERQHRQILGGALALLGLGSAWAAEPLTLKTLQVCDDAAEWPPFTYFARDASGKPRPEVMGYSVDVLRAILQTAGIQLQVQLLPWVRCLREVESGGQFLLAVNASASPERQQRFWMTQPYYDITPTYFFSRKTFPNGVSIRSAADLRRYHVCGVHGYNYSFYGLTDAEVDRGALDFRRVIAKLHARRCEIGLQELEAVAGLKKIGPDVLADPDLGWAEVPGLPKGEFHMLVTRQHPQGEALYQFLNQGIKTLRDSGKLQELRRRYLP
ncbi:substrate-binding periplasmic protein [Inhella gelatinilytica]|uniref:Transporter substrate-binding domain-containing protein n=1 Tax=Inhella gelatinilytica TaxID=2795030 RepID=A0A931IY13_9BURK|nr:transporter substrate-binding domain-containing protein [Inhella gelatinilytica]MBH9553095.1 transporter substrate-binding domain-containing protein [Inhella gelatinilytica]